MRNEFIKTLTELAQTDERIVLLTADLGFHVVEQFKEKFPKRFYNVGVAEQNMMGIASGLAEAGFLPFVYSIAPFAILRPYEFIRNDIIQQNRKVRIIAIGAGFAYGELGPSHHLIEDLAMVRCQSQMLSVIPADVHQAVAALKSTYECDKPVYYRLGKNQSDIIDGLLGSFFPGRAHKVQEGERVVIFSIGSTAREVQEALRSLTEHRQAFRHVVISCFNPSPIKDVCEYLQGMSLAVTVEDHSIYGGIGSLVAEAIAESGLNCRLHRFGVRNNVIFLTGSQSFMHHIHGFSPKHLSEFFKNSIQ